jgi:hypothetical protein
MKTLVVLSLLVAISLAVPYCTTENFASPACPAVLSDGTSVLNGYATVSSSPSGSLRIVGTSSECAFSFGSCSTTGVSSSSQILANAASGSGSITFSFGALTMYSFSIGKAWANSASTVITVRFYKDGQVVLSDLLARIGVNCVDPSTGSWSPAGGFDAVTIEGSQIAIADINICFNRAYLFTGGSVHQLIGEGDCIECVDGLGSPAYLQLLCEGTACNTLQFTEPDCSTFFVTNPTITDSISALSTNYPIADSVCVLTHGSD